MKALLDVVRAQHTATEGSEERPYGAEYYRETRRTRGTAGTF